MIDATAVWIMALFAAAGACAMWVFRPVSCPRCDGTGRDHRLPYESCQMCKGTGRVSL